MSFETIVGVLLSALIPKIFEKIQLKKGMLMSKVFKLVLILFVFFVFLMFNNNIVPKFLDVPEINQFYIDVTPLYNFINNIPDAESVVLKP